ncbi:MAG: sugar transporter [Candidatus Binatia bacterium]|nr:MAG: sugar transporter [Candidatus Binatia bacterium]
MARADARPPLSTRLFYGVGSVADGTKNASFNVFLLFYYNQVLGLSGTLSGLAIFAALCVDAITDPLVGSLSDSFRSRWGRRHPFMYASALPTAVSFALLFSPPSGLGQTGLFFWLLAFAVGVRVFLTFYLIPSGSMLPELTPDYDERTSLVSYRFFFGWAGGLLTAQMGYLYFFAPSERFADGRFDPDAYGSFGLAAAALIFFAILACAAGTHRWIPRLRAPTGDSPFSLGRLRDEVRAALRNRSFRMLVLGAFFASVAAGFNDVFGLYMTTYFWRLETREIGILVWALALGVVLAVLATRSVTQRFDKKRTAVALSAAGLTLGPLPVFLRLGGAFPGNDDPLLLPLLFVHSLAMGVLVVSSGITIASMVADIVDEHELETGRRQEGVFVAALAFVGKTTSGLGGLLAGAALDAIGFPRGAEPGSVGPELLLELGLVAGPLLLGLYLLALLCLARYEITRERHGRTLAALAARSSAAAGS